jgi:hypothetical protein
MLLLLISSWKKLLRPNVNDEKPAELILSDITVMGQGYCVVGLEKTSSGSFRSIRPMPPRYGYAWPRPFKRGEAVYTRLRTLSIKPPHTEDHQSDGLRNTGKTLDEAELVAALKQAEVAITLEEMFGCEVQPPHSRGNCWVSAGLGRRSICGVALKNIYFQIYEEPRRVRLRAHVSSGGGQRLNGLPVVDHEWVTFLTRLIEYFGERDAVARAQKFLNGSVRRSVMNSPLSFARIGLARGIKDSRCWLMLDSLFPQPKEFWLDGLNRR